MKNITQNCVIESRLHYLDSLRGLAILSVLFFHTYARWPDLMPYGGIYKEFVLFKYGYLGVYLFFLISGFVILMSLERCSTFKEFIKKRWLRLFPAMLIASILIFLTASFLYERPMGAPRLADVVSGITFINPFFLQIIFGGRWGMLEGAFWTLFVEVVFYILFGLSFFYKRKKAIQILAILSIIGMLVRCALKFNILLGLPVVFWEFFSTLGLQYFCWFTTGALTYEFNKKKEKKYLFYLLISGFFSAMTMLNSDGLMSFFISICIVMIFIAPLFNCLIEKVLSNRVLVFFGFISYPLYLLHEDAVVALVIKLGNYQNFIPTVALPVIPISVVVLVAYIIARCIEPAAKNMLSEMLNRSL